jgi:hypothetical protein
MEHRDVLIACGQGTYENGSFHCEFPDRDVYLSHALNVRHVVSEYRYNFVVCSGGFTQAATPHLSEARSFQAIWQDTGTRPDIPEGDIIFDEHSLDSAENVYVSLMLARRHLGADLPIRRVGVSAAWKFKKHRFTSLARELGIDDCFYFHGYADARAADAPDAASHGESGQMAEISEKEDFLLLGRKWAEKRRTRYRGRCVDGRFGELPKAFPGFFSALEAIARDGSTDARRKDLRRTFAQEIMQCRP